MPSKNLSVREADEPLWQRAEQRASTSSISLSSLVAQALAAFLDEDIYGRITVEVNGRREGFRGRWLVAPGPGVQGVSPTMPNGRKQGPFVAETARGRIAVWIPEDCDPDGSGARLVHYDYMAEASFAWEGTFDTNLWNDARDALKESTVIWRDI